MPEVRPWLLLAAFVADLALGDPVWMPHPVRLFGTFISQGEKIIRRITHSPLALFCGGALLTLTLTAGVAGGTWLLLRILSEASPIAGTIVTIYLAYSTLSVRGLDTAGTAVVTHLGRNELAEARRSLAMIVGRDTDMLAEPEILRAVTETMAENCSDGVVTPLVYLALGGAPAALTYKAINTLDSMIGYRNERYLYFGKFAARLDDVANFVPARLTAVLVALAAPLVRLNPWEALRIVRRDAHLQPSPNSGYPEAAFAGALGVRLGGLNFYGRQPSVKAYLGDARNALTTDLFARVRRLFYATSTLMLVVGVVVSRYLWTMR
jgi:adenosylcobinamide-phosphate synthase